MKIITISIVVLLFVGLSFPVLGDSNPDSENDLFFYLAENYTIEKCDLNKDGYTDIVIANFMSGSNPNLNSYIYWGASNGYSNSNRTDLPTYGAIGVSVSDLNKDGWSDIVFANCYDGDYYTNSFIYWGSSSGYSASNRTELPTFKARGVATSDLNNDGYIDIAFSCLYIYWGSGSGYSSSNRTSLDHSGGTTVSLADINNDQYIDIVLSDYYNNATYVYWGSNSGYSTSNRTQLSSIGPWAGVAVMQSYFSPPPNEVLRPKLEALMKHMQGRMHNIEKLLAEIEAKLPAEIPDEIQDKLTQVEELIKEAENSKSPAEANKLLNEARDILKEILNSLL